jgi:hypothetical protein
MRELVSSTIKQKPTIALVDVEEARGGLSVEEVHVRLIAAESRYANWSFDAELTPSGQALYDHLFQAEPIEWNRECSHETRLSTTVLSGSPYAALLQASASSKT